MPEKPPPPAATFAHPSLPYSSPLTTVGSDPSDPSNQIDNCRELVQLGPRSWFAQLGCEKYYGGSADGSGAATGADAVCFAPSDVVYAWEDNLVVEDASRTANQACARIDNPFGSCGDGGGGGLPGSDDDHPNNALCGVRNRVGCLNARPCCEELDAALNAVATIAALVLAMGVAALVCRILWSPILLLARSDQIEPEPNLPPTHACAPL